MQQQTPSTMLIRSSMRLQSMGATATLLLLSQAAPAMNILGLLQHFCWQTGAVEHTLWMAVGARMYCC
jgi:hypothetical protein